MSAGKPIVVDTCVWLDYLLGDRANHEAAWEFVVEATRRGIPLVIPSHSLKDLFLIFQQILKAANRADGKMDAQAAAESARAAAWAALDLVMELATVGPADQSDAWLASKQRSLHSDYEDNLVVACAMRLDARLLVTSDETLAKRSPVATLAPADALAFIAC